MPGLGRQGIMRSRINERIPAPPGRSALRYRLVKTILKKNAGENPGSNRWRLTALPPDSCAQGPDSGLRSGISAVLCCHNSAEVIEPTIRALSRQEVPADLGYEVILVDNNCDDRTVDLAKAAWEGAVVPLRVVTERIPGLIHARRKGVSVAAFDTVLFVDDDNILEPNWASRLPELFRRMPNVGVIGGRNVAETDGEEPVWFNRFQAMFACGPRAERAALNPKKNFGAGLGFRTELVRSVLSSSPPMVLTGREGSRPSLGEDSEMVLRCQLSGWDFYYEPSLVLRHRIQARRLHWPYLRSLAAEGGRAWIILQIYMRMLDRTEPPSLGGLGFEILGRWLRFFRKHKWRGFGADEEGSWRSLGRARLEGMVRGMRTYGAAYPRIRRRIINHPWRQARP
jgi:glycosyltransferase involved in cell wall biosynthesis